MRYRNVFQKHVSSTAFPFSFISLISRRFWAIRSRCFRSGGLQWAQVTVIRKYSRFLSSRTKRFSRHIPGKATRHRRFRPCWNPPCARWFRIQCFSRSKSRRFLVSSWFEKYIRIFGNLHFQNRQPWKNFAIVYLIFLFRQPQTSRHFFLLFY